MKGDISKAPTMEEEIDHVASKLRRKFRKQRKCLTFGHQTKIPFLIITLNHLRFWLTSLQVLSMSIRRYHREKKP